MQKHNQVEVVRVASGFRDKGVREGLEWEKKEWLEFLEKQEEEAKRRFAAPFVRHGGKTLHQLFWR